MQCCSGISSSLTFSCTPAMSLLQCPLLTPGPWAEPMFPNGQSAPASRVPQLLRKFIDLTIY
ncbi:unnamed protein product [Staurois parvus]|uniref:Uncharacterized protein n=1 Tax=Staurois parvus TaxID=386267 RepID=A0ABN9H1K6_9NEOB|nr:unnamed protein product [Staurois parvus]